MDVKVENMSCQCTASVSAQQVLVHYSAGNDIHSFYRGHTVVLIMTIILYINQSTNTTFSVHKGNKITYKAIV